MLLNQYDLTLVRFGASVLGRDRLWDRLSRKRAMRAEDGYTHRPGDQPSPRLPHEEVALESLPQFCRVQAHVSVSTDSLINFEVWVPDKWNGKGKR